MLLCVCVCVCVCRGGRGVRGGSPLPWIFKFVTLPLKIPEKKVSPWKFCKGLWHPFEFQMSKTKTHGDSTLIFCELPWKFLEITFVCFSIIAQCNLIAVAAFIPVSTVAFHDFKSLKKGIDTTLSIK